MAIWMSWNIDIRRSLNCHDSFPRRKFKGKSKIGLRQAVDHVTYYVYQPSVLSSVRKWEEIDLEMCSCGQLSEGQMLCDLDLGSGQGHISMHNTCCTTSTPNHVTLASPQYRNMAIWMSWNIDIPWRLNCSDSFPRRKFENRAPTSCRPGPILSMPTISFELHAKLAVEIDLEMCSYGQLSEVQMVHDLHLDLGSGQGHINIHSTCGTTNLPKHVTVASRTTEIRPFEFRGISTICEVWTLMKTFPGGNSKIEVAKIACQFSQLRKLCDLDLELRSGGGHAGAHMQWRSTHTPN